VNEASMSYVRADGVSQAARSCPSTQSYPGGLGPGIRKLGPSGWVHNNWNWHDVLTSSGSHSIASGIDVDRQQDLDNFTAGLDRPTSTLPTRGFRNRPSDYQTGPIIDIKAERRRRASIRALADAPDGSVRSGRLEVSRRVTLNLGLPIRRLRHMEPLPMAPIAALLPRSGSGLDEQVGTATMKIRGSNGAVVINVMWRWFRAWDLRMTYSATERLPCMAAGGCFTIDRRFVYVDGIRTKSAEFANPSGERLQAGTTLSISPINQ